MSAIKIYSNDSLWIVMWDHRPPVRFAPHGKICDILRAAIKSHMSADMLSLRTWYSVGIHVTYSLLHACDFFRCWCKCIGQTEVISKRGRFAPCYSRTRIVTCFRIFVSEETLGIIHERNILIMVKTSSVDTLIVYKTLLKVETCDI